MLVRFGKRQWQKRMKQEVQSFDVVVESWSLTEEAVVVEAEALDDHSLHM